jgi:tRNA (guanine26-N2/guanine27-N2)-dimethyltransferase
METVKEGKAIIRLNTAKIVSKDMQVFYNPVMEFNRTISVLLLNALDKKNMQIGLPLAGSGIRGIRFLKELKKGKIKIISLNDYDKNAVKNIKSNMKQNKIKLTKKIMISNQDANLFLLNSHGFDFIDIDPFGTPNPFLDSAVRRISRGGILAITATDTGALSGTYIKACLRKYWALPSRTAEMHEIGLRILIRKCQFIGAQFDKALIPVFSYSRDHYMRVFFLCRKGKEKVDEVLKQHGKFENSGPMWLGKLWDERLVDRIVKKNKTEENSKFLKIIQGEAKIDVVGFYHIPSFIKKNKLKDTPKQEKIIDEIRKKGFKANETHFKDNSIRTDIPEKELVKIIGNFIK